MARLIACRIGFGPRPNALGIGARQLRHVARRVPFGIAIFRRSRPREELPHHFDAVVGCVGKTGLFIAQLGDVRRFHHGVPEIAGAPTNLFEDPAPHLAGALSERLEFGRSVILLAQPTHRPRHRGSVLVGRGRPHFATERTLIFGVKRLGAGPLAKADLWLSCSAEINSHIAVAVNILDDVTIKTDTTLVAQTDFHHKASHSFFCPASSSSAANASSSFIRSQTHRPSMRFGRGIRPSATISSNLVTPTPIYSAAWTRERPRGASEGGKQLTEFRTIRLDSLIDCGSLHSQCAVARLSQDRIREADLTRT